MTVKKNVLLLASVVLSTTSCASAFTAGNVPKNSINAKINTVVSSIPDLNTAVTPELNSRRDILRSMTGIAFGVATAVVSRTEEADASYTAYTQREQDWEARQKKGDVAVSTARDLKAQLREIAPMNNAKSTIFCPNGPSSAVSPLMENKCNDVLAAPSVFGRTSDIAGNSIPGAANGRVSKNTVPSGASTLSAEVGFPSYR